MAVLLFIVYVEGDSYYVFCQVFTSIIKDYVVFYYSALEIFSFCCGS